MDENFAHWTCYDLYIHSDLTEEFLNHVEKCMKEDSLYQKFKAIDECRTFYSFDCEDNVRVDFIKENGLCSIQIVKFDSI